MVSSLWKACQDGDVAKVDELLVEATSVDIEIKDHTGVTPLILAVKGSHLAIVKALVAKGADPTNASAQGRPETYSTDPQILQVLAVARGEPVMQYPDPAQFYQYPPYPPYPPYPDPNASWYPPPPPQQIQTEAGEHGSANLPPPEVARNIPCRYYPACRYGSACVFLHPQTPYFPGPLPPPAQYGPPPPPPLQQFDPTMPPPPGAYTFYPVSPPFGPHPPPPHSHPLSHPGSPPAPGHMRAHSEILSPPPFSPPHLPVSVPVPVMGYAPPQMSPTYASYPSPVGIEQVGEVNPNGNGHANPHSQSHPHPQPNGNVNGHANHNGYQNGRPRRGSAAFRDREGRPAYGGGGGRKPPCLFFPSGRCRNGDDCRFPHVMPESGPAPHAHRGNFAPRSRGYGGGPGAQGGNGFTGLEERIAGMRVGDNNGSHDANAASGTGTTTPHSSSAKHLGGSANGRAQAPVQTQRVPSADEFPVLQANGHSHTNGHINGHAHGHANTNGWVNAMNGTGPTAAQILREGASTSAMLGSSRESSPRPTKEVKPQSSAPTTATAPENLASNKPAEVQVSA